MKLAPEMFEFVPKEHPHYGKATREAQAFFTGFKPAITMPFPLFTDLVEDNVEMDHLLYEIQRLDNEEPYGVIFFNNESVRQSYLDHLTEEDSEQQVIEFGQLLGYPLEASKFFSRVLAGKEDIFPRVHVEFSGIQFIASKDTLVEDINWLAGKYSVLYPLKRCMMKMEFMVSPTSTLSVLEWDGGLYSVDGRILWNMIMEPLDLISHWVNDCFKQYQELTDKE